MSQQKFKTFADVAPAVRMNDLRHFKKPAEIVPPVKDTQPIIPNQHNQPNILNQPKPVAPQKDYSKVANSIAREAVPERLFKGMSKNTYDALYLKTRGAINPIRRIRATKSDLIRWTGVSDVTLDKHIKHLKSVGLINVEFIIGSHDGNWYEILIPEEIDIPNQPNQPNIPKKVGEDIPNLVGDVGRVQSQQNIDPNGVFKTSLKTRDKNDDDARASEAFAVLTERLDAAVKKLTGKGTSKYEADKWGILADLLILELEIAAKRTGEVSSVPAFLTEVLRRQLFAARQTLLTNTGEASNLKSSSKAGASKVKPDTVGQSRTGSYEIAPLNERGREEALFQLQEFAGDDFLTDFKKWYVEEDWEWLMENLERVR